MIKACSTIAALLLAFALPTTADASTTAYGTGGVRFTEGEQSLKIRTEIQNGFTYENALHQDGATERDRSGFRIPLAKTYLSGNVFNRNWSYLASILLNNEGILQEARLTYSQSPLLKINFGRDKVPFSRELMDDNLAIPFTSRSIVGAAFSQDRGTGIWANGQLDLELGLSRSNPSLVKYWFGVFNGDHDAANGFNNSDSGTANSGALVNTDFNYMISGRIEFFPFGEGKNIRKYVSDIRDFRERHRPELMIGAAFTGALLDRSEGLFVVDKANGVRKPVDGGLWNVTLDARLQWYGWSTNIAVFHRTIDSDETDPTPDPPVSHDNSTDKGIMGSVGYNWSFGNGRHFEAVARIGWIDADDSDNVSGFNDLWQYGLGFNYRLMNESLRFSGDIHYIREAIHNGGGDIDRVVIAFIAQFDF